MKNRTGSVGPGIEKGSRELWVEYGDGGLVVTLDGPPPENLVGCRQIIWL